MERKVDTAEVCCGPATWSGVALGGGFQAGPVIDNDRWCCNQAEQLGLTAYHFQVEDPEAWEVLVEAAPWAVVGSPPWPPFSVAGEQRGWQDSSSQTTLWSLTAAILSGARVLAMEQDSEVGKHWGVLSHLAKAAGWPVSSLPFAAAERDRVVIFGAPATAAGSDWINEVGRALAKLRGGEGPGAAQEGSVPGQILQAMQLVGGHPGSGALDFARLKRGTERCSLPTEVVDNPWTRQALARGGEQHWEDSNAICFLIGTFMVGDLGRAAMWAVQLCLAHGQRGSRPQNGTNKKRRKCKKKKKKVVAATASFALALFAVLASLAKKVECRYNLLLCPLSVNLRGPPAFWAAGTARTAAESRRLGPRRGPWRQCRQHA